MGNLRLSEYETMVLQKTLGIIHGRTFYNPRLLSRLVLLSMLVQGY